MQKCKIKYWSKTMKTKKRRRKPRQRRFRLRQLVRDYAVEELQNGTPESEVADAVSRRLAIDFEDRPILKFLLEILREIIPLLLDAWLSGKV